MPSKKKWKLYAANCGFLLSSIARTKCISKFIYYMLGISFFFLSFSHSLRLFLCGIRRTKYSVMCHETAAFWVTQRDFGAIRKLELTIWNYLLPVGRFRSKKSAPAFCGSSEWSFWAFYTLSIPLNAAFENFCCWKNRIAFATSVTRPLYPVINTERQAKVLRFKEEEKKLNKNSFLSLSWSPAPNVFHSKWISVRLKSTTSFVQFIKCIC